MKKILLATSALMLTAVAANAQAVRIGGEGRMGILWESISLGGVSVSEWAQENRLQLNFSVSVEADHGLSFGAFTRARITNGATGVFSGSRVWVEASNFRLTFGNIDGAIRGAGVSHGYAGGCGVGYVGGHFCGDTAGLVGGIGGIGLVDVGGAPGVQGAAIMPGQTQGFASTGGGNPAMARIDYSFGETRVALSHQRNGSTELGIRTRFDAFTVALGYANRANLAVATADPLIFTSAQVPGNVIALSGHYNGGTWGVGLLAVRVSYSGALSPLTHTNYSLSGNVELGGGNLYAYVGRVNHASLLNGRVSFNVAGISYGYGLGGGATLTAGLERFSGAGLTGTSASVGVAFNF